MIRKISLQKFKEFDDHKLFVSFAPGNTANLHGFIAIHRGGIERPAFGATRFWNYENEENAIKDVLNLSRTMSYKAASAGLAYGGAKGVIIGRPKSLAERRQVLLAYAQEVNYLKGGFITGTDVGISQSEVRLMRTESPYFVGYKIDPTYYTCLGLFYAMETCLKYIFGSESFCDRTVAIKGMGKIGAGILDMIYPEAKKVYVADIDRKKIEAIKRKYPNVSISTPETIHKKRVDIFSPCSLGNAIGRNNVSELKSTIIVGGANNQLESNRVADRLHRVGILYAPDYIVNAGGLISVTDEFTHRYAQKKRIEQKVKRIKSRLSHILELSEKRKVAPSVIAYKIAEKIVNG